MPSEGKQVWVKAYKCWHDFEWMWNAFFYSCMWTPRRSSNKGSTVDCWSHFILAVTTAFIAPHPTVCLFIFSPFLDSSTSIILPPFLYQYINIFINIFNLFWLPVASSCFFLPLKLSSREHKKRKEGKKEGQTERKKNPGHQALENSRCTCVVLLFCSLFILAAFAKATNRVWEHTYYTICSIKHNNIYIKDNFQEAIFNFREPDRIWNNLCLEIYGIWLKCISTFKKIVPKLFLHCFRLRFCPLLFFVGTVTLGTISQPMQETLGIF